MKNHILFIVNNIVKLMSDQHNESCVFHNQPSRHKLNAISI